MPSGRKSHPLQADEAYLANLLKGDTEYRAPMFQRRYVWAKKEFDRLWTDLHAVIDEEGEAETRFLGALVLQDESGRLPADPSEYTIVDGQQRITTLYLLLIAVVELLQDKPATVDRARDLVRDWILSQGSQVAKQPKAKPTIVDLRQFNQVMRRIELETARLPTPYGPETGLLSKMYDRIRRQLVKEMKDGGPERVDRIASAALNNLKFVEIVLGDDDDPHQVFDSLNDAGVQLDIFDLVRNDVFYRLASDPDSAVDLHDTKWRAFEDGLQPAPASFVFPYALIKSSSTTKGRMFSDLRETWAGLDSEAIIDDMQRYVPPYMALTAARSILGAPSSISLGLSRLHRMPAPSSVYPFVMQLVRSTLDGELSEEDAALNLLLLESFLVRRSIAGIEPTGLHAVFKTMWQRSKGEPGAFVAEIKKRGTVAYPTDEEFAEDIRTEPLYGKRYAKYILTEYEHDQSGDAIPDGVKMTEHHEMPQHLTPAWKELVSSGDHAELYQTWANLVPLSNEGNAGKGQGTWEKVRQRLLAESIYKTTRSLALEYETWNSLAIRQRAKSLSQWALDRWPRTTDT